VIASTITSTNPHDFSEGKSCLASAQQQVQVRINVSSSSIIEKLSTVVESQWVV